MPSWEPGGEWQGWVHALRMRLDGADLAITMVVVLVVVVGL